VRWQFDGALPSGWTTSAGRVEADGGSVYMLSPMSLADDVASSPAATLAPGPYRMVVDGFVLTGGVELRAVDAETNQTLATAMYSQYQGGTDRTTMNVPFAVARRTPVKLVMASTSPFPNACAWVVHSAEIRAGALARPPAVEPAEARYYTAAASPLLAPPTGGRASAGWSFVHGLPPTWGPATQPLIHAPGTSVVVQTTETPSEYQVVSGAMSVGPGTYVVIVHGRPTTGGIEIGVRDTDRDEWYTTAHYWSGQTEFDRKVMTARFTLPKRANVSIVFANWAPEPRVSQWTVEHVTLVRER
jgi:hypothetical protein